MMIKKPSQPLQLIVALVFALVATSCWAQKPMSDNTPESYGACIMRNGSVSGINENEHFAMHSVMKFPQALYVADYMNRKGLKLDDTIVAHKADLMQDTWSPMLKQFEGKKAFSYAELFELSLGQSDNNACELLFKHCGKPQAVETYMRELGFCDIHVRMTEEQMHKNPAKATENSSTPAVMVRLFEWFYRHKDDNQYLKFVWKTMADCSTGQKRIPAAIPADAHIVHKTGTGFPSAKGAQDMNDAGIILMPDGSHAIIVVFTTHSPSEAVIANIAKQLLYLPLSQTGLGQARSIAKGLMLRSINLTNNINKSMKQKFCQSCGMPLTEEVLGTNADGSKNEDYCMYCYKDGKFLQDCTMEEMIDHCAQFVNAVNEGLEKPITKEEYIGMMKSYFPQLKRWRQTLDVNNDKAIRANPALAGVKELIAQMADKQPIAYISSVDQDGFPWTKAMLSPRVREGIKTFYFTTNTFSLRVAHYKANNKASIYFCDANGFKGMMLRGTMEVLTDAKSKEMIWRDGDEQYYPGGVTDPNYCVLKFTATDGRFYSDFYPRSFVIE